MKKLFALLSYFSFFQTGLIAQADYFQQEVNTTIQVKLNDTNHTLTGHVHIEYINNSPHTLHYIYIHLWPNAYKNGQTALAKQLFDEEKFDLYYGADEVNGYIDSLSFSISGSLLKWEYHRDYIDIAKIHLPEPLNPGEKTTIQTPFFVKIPSGNISRLGHIGQSYQITQWFPKPAVYDNKGWHYMPYLSQGEFYSEFGSYDVSITLPVNYVVGATGDLFQSEAEERFLDSLAKATEDYLKENEHILRKNKDQMDFPPSSEKWKTLRYKQANVHDFAWFADKRYHVLKGEVELPYSKRKVTTWAMFTNAEAHLWQKAIEYLNDGTYYYSLWNGEYPYNHVTAVDGSISAGAGMEYPNITVIGTSYNALGLETVIVHEVGHNWFYGILGSNERKNAWMDEGLNSFNESRYLRIKYPQLKLANHLGSQNGITEFFGLNRNELTYMDELLYQFVARSNIDQPIQYKAPLYTPINYGAIVYKKTALALRYLMDYLGEDTFDRAMQAYFESWKFKHPAPADLRAAFEAVSGKDLAWFFEDVIMSTRKMDYALVGLSKSRKEKEYIVKLRNRGTLQTPVPIDIIKGDSIKQTIWVEGFGGKQKLNLGNLGSFDKIAIDSRYNTPELYRKNNNLRAKGIFKTVEPLQFKLLGALENPEKTTIFFAPVVGWNNYNKLMPGLALYNSVVPRKKVEYIFVPMYAFGSKSFTGTGQLKAHIKPRSWFRNIDIGLNASTFDFYNANDLSATYLKVSPWVELTPWKNYLRSPHQNTITLRYNYVEQSPMPFSRYRDAGYLSNYVLTHQYSKRHAVAPFSLITSVEYGRLYGVPFDNKNDFLKASTTFNGAFRYNRKGRKIDYRIFAGNFFAYNTDQPFFLWRMGGQNGLYDYAFDHVFLGRSERLPDFWGRQVQLNHGAFKTPTFYSSRTWLTSANFRFELPAGPKLALFADVGLHPYPIDPAKRVGALYDFGLEIPLFKQAIRIFVPLVVSEDIQQEYRATGIDFWQRIRFQIDFDLLNPFNLIKNISL